MFWFFRKDSQPKNGSSWPTRAIVKSCRGNPVFCRDFFKVKLIMHAFHRLLLTGLLGFLIFGSNVSATPTGPAFSSIPELEEGYRLLYMQKFPEARDIFQKWAADHPDEPFGQVSIAASYLFEEFFLQRVLTSDYFLDDKRFLGGITGKPNPERIKAFEDAVSRARSLA